MSMFAIEKPIAGTARLHDAGRARIRGRGMLAVLAAAILIASAATVSARCTCGQASMEVDPASGLCLPLEVEGMARFDFPASQVAAFRSYRNTVATGFRHHQSGLFITLFLYDRQESGTDAEAREFQVAVDEILNFYPGARVLKSDSRTVSVADASLEARHSLFLLPDRNGEVVSFVWLMSLERRLLKVRTSYPFRKGNQEEMIQEALELAKRATAAICTMP